MRAFYIASLLAVALTVSGCAGMSGPHRHSMTGGPMAAGAEVPHGMMMGMMTPLIGCHGARGDVEARLASLRTVLHVTPAQEAAWGVYAGAYRGHAGHMGAGMMGTPEGARPALVERLRQQDAMMSYHLASFQALRAAIEPLYASFSDEQKMIADAMRCDRPS